MASERGRRRRRTSDAWDCDPISAARFLLPQSTGLHDVMDRRNRIWILDGPALRFVPLDEGHQDLQRVGFRRPRGGPHEAVDLTQRLVVVGFTPDRSNGHLGLLHLGGVDPAVLRVRSHKSHEANPARVVEPDDQSIPVPTNVEHHPVSGDDARASVNRLDVRWGGPVGFRTGSRVPERPEPPEGSGPLSTASPCLRAIWMGSTEMLVTLRRAKRLVAHRGRLASPKVG